MILTLAFQPSAGMTVTADNNAVPDDAEVVLGLSSRTNRLFEH